MKLPSIEKMKHILDAVRKDVNFYIILRDDPARTLQVSGVDLSPGETQGLLDIVYGTRTSLYAENLEPLAKLWHEIGEEMNSKYGHFPAFSERHQAGPIWEKVF